MTVLLVALWVLGALARPFDKWRALLVAAMVLGLVLVMAVPFARNFFALDIPSGRPVSGYDGRDCRRDVWRSSCSTVS